MDNANFNNTSKCEILGDSIFMSIKRLKASNSKALLRVFKRFMGGKMDSIILAF